MSNNTTEVSEVMLIDVTVSIPTIIFCVTVCLTGLLAGSLLNICVILTIWKTKSLRLSSINWAVFSLCIGDLITIFVEIPITLWILVANFLHFKTALNDHLCDAQSFVQALSSSLQLMSLPIIALERFFSISTPFDRTVQIRRVTLLNGMSWFISLSLAIVSCGLFASTPVSIFCDTRPKKLMLVSEQIIFLNFPLGTLSLLVTGFLYGLIVCTVLRQKRRSLANQSIARSRSNLTMRNVDIRPPIQIKIEVPSEPTPTPPPLPHPYPKFRIDTLDDLDQSPNEVNLVVDIEQVELFENPGQVDDNLMPMAPIVTESQYISVPSTSVGQSSHYLTVPVDFHWSKTRRSEVFDDASSSGRSSSSGCPEDESSFCTDQSWMSDSPPSSIRDGRSPNQSRAGSVDDSISSDIRNSESNRSKLVKHFHRNSSQLTPNIRAKRRSEAKMAKRSGCIVLIFLTLWLPLPVIVAWTRYKVQEKDLAFYLDFQLAAFCFWTISCTANPIIYGLAIKTFRKSFKRLFRKLRKRQN